MTINHPNTDRRPRARRGINLALALMAVTAAVALAGLESPPLGTPVRTVAMQSALQAAAPGSPGTTSAPVVVFEENFENNADNSPTGAKAYTSATGATAYVGATPAGQTYTASPDWINGQRCNGVVLSASNSTEPSWVASAPGPPEVNRCVPVNYSWQQLRVLARAMGTQFGGGDNDHISSSFTECNYNGVTCPTIGSGSTNGVMFQTNTPISVTPNHFYTFGVDTAYKSCNFNAPASHPRFHFDLVDASSTVVPMTAAPIDGCANPDAVLSVPTPSDIAIPPFPFGTVQDVAVKRNLDDTAVLYPSSALGVRLWNETNVTNGNDGSFDNVRVLDVTPRLDRTFSTPSTTDPRHTTATFTVTNTSDLLAKPGMSFTDQLPAGLTVAGSAVTSTTCSNATITATAGASTIAAAVDLNAGQTSCTITVDLVAAGPGTYVNPPSNFPVLVGLLPPATASVDVVEVINAVDDPFGTVTAGTSTSTVLANDTINGAAATTATVTLTPGTSPDHGLTMQADGTIAIADGTPAGDYSYPYTICSKAAPTVCDTATATLRILEHPAIALIKKLARVDDLNGNGISDTGDVAHYAFTVTNTGNTTLTDVAVVDSKAIVSGAVATLAPGVSTDVFTGTHTITKGEAVAGSVVNQATATGTSPAGTRVTDLSDYELPTQDRPTVTDLADTVPVVPLSASLDPARTPTGTGSTSPDRLASTGGHASLWLGIGLVLLGLGIILMARQRWGIALRRR